MAEEAGQILEAHILASLVPTTEVSVKHPKIFVTMTNLHISTYSLSATLYNFGQAFQTTVSGFNLDTCSKPLTFSHNSAVDGSRPWPSNVSS